MGVVGVDFALDMDFQFRDWTLDTEGVRQIAEGIFLRVDLAIRRNVDPPRADILSVVIARGHAQDLDHAGRRMGVAVDRVV
jgi:hypothetical protein